MKFARLAACLGQTGQVPDFQVTDLVYDSRKCIPGCVFVCLRGHSVDGHRYAQMAAEKGAGAIVAEEPVAVDIPVLLVENSRKALAMLSAEFFGHPARRLKTIGITGTKGKTTTAFMLKYILESAGYKVGVMGTIGVLIGDRLTPTENTSPESYLVQYYMAQMVEGGCDYCIMEASSIGLKDYRIYGFTFDCGAFSNFSRDHIGGVEHPDMEDYLKSKALLFQMCRVGAVNIDDAHVQGVLSGHSCKVLSFGFSPEADIVGKDCRLLARAGFLGSAMQVAGVAGEYPVEIGIPGTFNAYNALTAIAVCHSLGIEQEAVRDGLAAVKVKGRVEPVPMPGDFTLLIDYAHNAVSMESLLTTLRAYRPGRLVCLFGAGGNRPKVRRYEMGEICGNLADLSVITADNSRFEAVEDIIADIKTGMAKTSGKYIEIPDRRAAIRHCIENAQPGDIIVLAGKGHEDYQEIEGVKHPFDERVVIAEILEDLRKSS